MTLNQNIIDFTLAVLLLAATCTVLFIGGLSVSPASAAAKPSDISAVTHSAISAKVDQLTGHTEPFSRADISSRTHKSVPAGTQSIGRTSSTNYSRFDLNAVTSR